VAERLTITVAVGEDIFGVERQRFSWTNRATAVATEFPVDEDCVGFEPLEAAKLVHLKGFH
jgi:hypothetical protein